MMNLYTMVESTRITQKNKHKEVVATPKTCFYCFFKNISGSCGSSRFFPIDMEAKSSSSKEFPKVFSSNHTVDGNQKSGVRPLNVGILSHYDGLKQKHPNVRWFDGAGCLVAIDSSEPRLSTRSGDRDLRSYMPPKTQAKLRTNLRPTKGNPMVNSPLIRP